MLNDDFDLEFQEMKDSSSDWRGLVGFDGSKDLIEQFGDEYTEPPPRGPEYSDSSAI